MSNQGTPRLFIYVITAIGLLAAVLFGQYAGQGNIKNIFMAFGACAGVAFFLILGKNYWMLLVFAFTSGLPALPIGGKTMELGELASFACFVVFLAMVALRKNNMRLGGIANLSVFAFIGWMLYIYSQNPVGMGMLGAQDVGIRGYLKNIFALFAFLVISNQIVTERDCKWLLRIIVIGPFLALGWSILQYKFLGAGGFESDEGLYTWHQSLSTPAFVTILYIFCKYGANRVLSMSFPALLPLVIALIGVALLSGKRAVAASALLTPLVATMLRGQQKYALIFAIGSSLVISVLVVGQGNLFELPYTVQRALVNLPGDWDSNLLTMRGEAGDSFRETMRKLAWERIQKNPIVGEGMGFSMSDVANINPGNYAQNIEISLALGNSWHNTWLGLWADFGLPAIVIHAVICILCGATLWRAFSKSRPARNTNPSAFNIVAMMILIQFIFLMLRSYTSGSSNIPYNFWWEFGLAVAMLRSLPRKAQDQMQPSSTPRSQDSQPEPGFQTTKKE